MEESLKIALVQSSLVWENPEANRQIFSEKLKTIANDVDVIILPEMFTTGFTMLPKNIDIEEGKITVEWMQKKAKEKDSALIGSIVYTEETKNYNRLYFAEPNGSLAMYDKRHAFTLAGEHEKYTAGKRPTLVNYKGFKFYPLICYDLRFPVWSRNTDNYDVLLYVANWPKPRINAWDALLKARAIENMSYCIGVNRTGTDDNGHEYPGHSALYDCLGSQLAFSNREEIIEITVYKGHLQETRNKLGFLKDRDNFNLKD